MVSQERRKAELSTLKEVVGKTKYYLHFYSS